ncbi:MAG: HAD-IA family hydrolase [Pseudomonadota bacterium]
MPLKALLLGSISVVADTSELQREAYNSAFREAGLDWSWDRATYRDMLMINGGKKRLEHYSKEVGTELSAAQMEQIHADKTRIFDDRMQQDGIGLRTGIARLISEAKGAGVKVGFVSATSRANIEALAQASRGALNLGDFDVVTDGSMVDARKPDPAIYTLALEKLGVDAADALAIEDTATSAQSAVDACITTIGLPNANAKDQDWSGVKAVFSSLGDGNEAAAITRSPVEAPDQIDIGWLRKLLDA